MGSALVATASIASRLLVAGTQCAVWVQSRQQQRGHRHSLPKSKGHRRLRLIRRVLRNQSRVRPHQGPKSSHASGARADLIFACACAANQLETVDVAAGIAGVAHTLAVVVAVDVRVLRSDIGA